MHHTKATKDLLSKMRRGELNPFYGKKHTSKTRAKLARILRIHGSKGHLELSPVAVKVPAGLNLGYFAGLVDGEGSVRFYKGRNPSVKVYNSDRRIMLWLKRNVGGSVGGHDKRGRKICYCWSVVAVRGVYVLLQALAPVVIAKTSDVTKALQFLQSKYGHRLD